MTERSPITACLLHLTQRDAAVRARALEAAAKIARDLASEMPSGSGRGYVLDLADDILALIPTPPAPAPDEAAIRAELIAALRAMIEPFAMTPDNVLAAYPDTPQPRAILAARAALAKATP